MCLATAPARKKVNTPTGGTFSRMTIRVKGARVVVSSVPDTRPIAANRAAPIRHDPCNQDVDYQVLHRGLLTARRAIGIELSLGMWGLVTEDLLMTSLLFRRHLLGIHVLV